MNQPANRYILLLMATLLLPFYCTTPSRAEELPQQAKYIFLFIGDGMGMAQRQAAELFLAVRDNLPHGEYRLAMNKLPTHGITTTYGLSRVIVDSASAGTAIATGYIPEVGELGIDKDGNPLLTVAEAARDKGIELLDNPDGFFMMIEGSGPNVLTAREQHHLRAAFTAIMAGVAVGDRDEETYLRYGKYDPLVSAVIATLNHKAGVTWGTRFHTAAAVMTSAIGPGHERFGGLYHLTALGKMLKHALEKGPANE